MKFLIQTFEGEIRHDFSFTLLESIRYNNWLTENSDNSTPMEYKLTDGELYENYIPVGSVEFVVGYMQQFLGRSPKPINVPEELMDEKYSGRILINGDEKVMDLISEAQFVKSNDQIKGFKSLLYAGEKVPQAGNYQYSSLMDIESEWRSFIYKDKLVGLQHYSGDFKLFPSIERIEEMISVYTNAPVAYTLDVYVNKNGTFVVEVHDFFSCGLYGFSDHRIYPFMLSQWYYKYKNIN